MHNSLMISIIMISVSASAFADDWPQFLGPHRNGVSSETGLIDSFPKDGPKRVWSAPLGVGMSNVAVADSLVVTMYQDGQSQYVVALDEETGQQKWQTVVGPAYENGQGNGPRTTPTIDDGRIYALTGEGILAALDAKNGKLLWSVNTPSELGGKSAEYGMASSPLVHDKRVIVQVGSTKGTVAAYDTKSGKQVWTAGRGTAGYSSPVLMTLAGRDHVVALTGASVLGLNPTDGTVLWQFAYVTDYDCNTASPVQLDDSSVLISAAENHGSTILKISARGAGLLVTPSWTSLGNDSVLRAEWQTPALLDGHLFGMDNLGSAGPITNLVCVRVSDGEQLWIQRRFGKSNLTLADGKLFISTMKGELVLVKATTEGFSEVSRAQILEKMTRQAPVIANGRLYMRDDSEVVCLDIRK